MDRKKQPSDLYDPSAGAASDFRADVRTWAAKKRPLFSECELVVETLPAITYCEDCQKTYPTVQYGKICPHCGSEHTYLVQGNEFNIKEIEVH